MKPYRNIVALVVFLPVLFSHGAGGEKRNAPTHADAAVIVAKYSGLFDRYVDESATLSECVSFLNKKGIYFGLLEVVNGQEFSKSDAARVLGQIELLLSGEAEFSHGKVKLPKEIDSWVGFCIMNGVEYIDGYESIVNGVNRLRHIRK